MLMLPQPVRECMDALEAAGYPTYAVGGCVRDACLGLTPHDYDLCTAALPEQTEAVFAHRRLILAGKKHGTVAVITDGDPVEITTFRTEGDYQDNRHPGWVAFVPEVEGDLARRDFTVNAMAWSPTRGFADPFGGREDLKNHILRAVGDPTARFSEDALRILRGVRFAVRFGLTPEPETEKAMLAMAHRLPSLSAERIFGELSRLLPRISAGELVRFAPILGEAIPELKPAFGFCQHSRHHAHDLLTHTALVVQGVGEDPALRWAALLHDLGKPQCMTMGQDGQGHFYGHAAVSARIAQEILLRLKAPNALRERVVLLIEKHMTPLEPDRRLLRRRLAQLGQEALEQLLQLQMADTDATGVSRGAERFAGVGELIGQLAREQVPMSAHQLAVNGRDLVALGLEGPQIGRVQRRLLEMVLEEAVPNTRQALLAAAGEYKENEI